jgi:F0F1-type ATP synthase alpha subunit
VKSFCSSFVKYLGTTQKPFIEIVSTTNQFTDEAEASLKEIILEVKDAYSKSK